jgi:hypothetical protein
MGKEYTGLLHLYFYVVSGDEIWRRRNNKKYWNYLPDYTFDDDGKIRWTDNYLQFAFEEDYDYVLFDYECADKVLQQEIDNMGLEYVLKDVDFRDQVYHVNDITCHYIPEPTVIKIKQTWYGNKEVGFDYDIEVIWDWEE